MIAPVVKITKDDFNCDNCSIDWIDDDNLDVTDCGGSYYGLWSYKIKTSMKSRSLAHKIADLALDKLNELYPEDLILVKRIINE